MPPVGPNPSVNVRPATGHDAAFLADVVVVTARAQGRLPGRLPEDVAHSTTYVIEIDGERAGRLRLVRDPSYRELAAIQLLPAHQGHGLGTHLIEQFLVEARDEGLPARVSVERDNPRARALYERLGFVAVDESGEHTRMEWRG